MNDIAKTAVARGLPVATAESCAGGMVAAALTDVAGASQWFVDRVVSYDNAVEKLCVQDTPAGKMPVVLGPGWAGILLHEAVGHGLEDDFNRKGLSAFSGKVGQRVIARGVTVIDADKIDGITVGGTKT